MAVHRSPAVLAAAAAVPVALLAGVLAFWRLGGFAGSGGAASQRPGGVGRPGGSASVDVSGPSLSGPAGDVCRTVVAKLPDAVRQLRRRPVTSGSERAAAYGDPPITLTCGAPVPSVAPTATVYPLSGVCWYAEERPDATVWTTLDRDVPVQVTVPRRYSAPGQWVIEFSPVVAAAQSPRPGPPGCTG